MKTSHGVIQGYNGLSLTDSKHQVIMYSEAFGSSHEHEFLKTIMESAKEVTEEIELGEDYFKNKKFIADTGNFSEVNLKYLAGEDIDAYIPDQQFRKRDPRFMDRDRFRDKKKKEERYKTNEFIYDKDNNRFICPAGKYLKFDRKHRLKNTEGRYYRSSTADCRKCRKRDKCLKSDKSARRNIYVVDNFFDRNYSEEMFKKRDSLEGRDMYSKRMGIVEPVFGNIRHCKGLDKFTLRTRKKVNIQWNLFCIIHNIEKIFRYGKLGFLKA